MNSPAQEADAGFHHAQIEIIVNGRRKVVDKERLSYDEVLHLAYDPLPNEPDTVYTISYHRAAERPPQGTLIPGEIVRIERGTIFNVSATHRS